MLAFRIAVERWMKSGDDEPFALHTAAALSDLQVRAAELDSRSRLSTSRGVSAETRTGKSFAGKGLCRAPWPGWLLGLGTDV
jgi:hypothetical protein